MEQHLSFLAIPDNLPDNSVGFTKRHSPYREVFRHFYGRHKALLNGLFHVFLFQDHIVDA